MINREIVMTAMCVVFVSMTQAWAQGDLEADKKLQKDIPKELQDVKSVSLTVAQVKGKVVTIDIRNNTGGQVSFIGYSIQSPMYRIQKQVGEKWVENQLGWCGTGDYNPVLNSKKYCVFIVNLPKKDQVYRVGVDVSMLNGDEGEKKTMTVWTETVGASKQPNESDSIKDFLPR